MVIMRLTIKFRGRRRPSSVFRAVTTYRLMRLKGQGDTAMVIALFVGGMFLGFSLGVATMALLEASSPHFQGEEAEEREEYPACAYSPAPKFSPSLEARPRTAGLWLIPGP
jgi:hypothetical protein